MEEEMSRDGSQEPPSQSSGLSAVAYQPNHYADSNEEPPQLKVVWNKQSRSEAPVLSSERTLAFRRKFYPQVPDKEWNDWHWQLRNRITSFQELARFLRLSDAERLSADRPEAMFPLAVTPYFLSLIDSDHPDHGLRRTVIPNAQEYYHAPGEAEDPLGEENDSPLPGLVHRYPDRVLFLVTDYCSTYCRYCTRSRIVGKKQSQRLSQERWQKALQYIADTPAVRDVLLSGGDPLTMSNDRLEWLLARLRQIPHVEIVRIGTKVPVVLPQRITPALIRMLKRYHPLWLSIHFAHPDELTPETQAACRRLADGGIPLGSQTVLLAGVNDNVDTMKRLYQGLLKIRVKPYYLYQCDPIVGSKHFRTPVSKGLEIIQGLRGHTSGYAVPSYVIDGPGGGGKIPLLPGYVIGRDGNDILLKNYQGRICRYPDTPSCGDGQADNGALSGGGQQ